MEKETRKFCPKCSQLSLDIFYDTDTGDNLGVRCLSCGLRGMFVGNKLVALVEA